MESMIKEYIGTLIRTLLAPVAAYLLATGYFTDSEVGNTIAAIAVVAVAVIWGLLNKFYWKKTVDVALTLPANTSPAKLEDVIANK